MSGPSDRLTIQSESPTHSPIYENPLRGPAGAAGLQSADTIPEAAGRGGLGWGWLGLMILFGLVALGWGCVWAVREISARGWVERLNIHFGHVSLLPSPRVQTPEPEMRLQLYYIVRGEGLAPQTRQLRRPAQSVEHVYLIAREIQRPPETGLLRSPLPPGSHIRGLYLYEGIVWIDLDEPFLQPKDPSPQLERLVIYSLVNSFMLNDPTLQGVRFMIEGKPVETAWGWLDLSSPLGPDLSLLTQ